MASRCLTFRHMLANFGTFPSRVIVTLFIVFSASGSLGASGAIRCANESSIPAQIQLKTKQIALELSLEAQSGLAHAGFLPIAPAQEAPKSIGWHLDGVRAQQESFRYEGSFATLLRQLNPENPLKDFSDDMIARRESNRTNNVLDLFGSGLFLKDPSLADSISGIRFDKIDHFDPSTMDPTLIPAISYGDIFNPKTWNDLDASMLKRGVPSMDLIVMRPYAGWSYAVSERRLNTTSARPDLTAKDSPLHAEISALALQFVVAEVLARLSPDGHFYFSLYLWHKQPQKIAENQRLQDLVKKIESTTPYRLILLDEGNWIGMLVPKDDIPHP